MEAVRDMNFMRAFRHAAHIFYKLSSGKFSILNCEFKILFVLAASFLIASCSKKPIELYNDGIKSFTAGNYEKAQENFSDEIKKDGNDSLYAGFIAANLITGKYPQVTQSYNDFTNGIHDTLVKMFGEAAMKYYGATTEIIPYKTGGGNKIPPDFPQTVAIQARADSQGFLAVKQQINNVIKK